jgi:PBP1b-binding outer membrane lipoprotein LpoB
MLKQVRLLMSIAVFALVVTACGEEQATEQTAAPAATETTSAADLSVDNNMTEAAAIAKFGEPSLSQTREIDSLKVTHHEWTTDKGTLSIQFFNGEAKYNQFTTTE